MITSGTNKKDSILGTDFSDSIDGLGGNDTIEGGGGGDRIIGGAGNDILSAFKSYDDNEFVSEWLNLFGDDVDYLYGGVGNDIYILDSWVIGDHGQVFIIEELNQGTDTIIGSVSRSRPSFTMPENIENYVNDTSLSDNGTPIYVEVTGNNLNNLIQTGPKSWNDIYKLTSGIDEFHNSYEFFSGGDGNDTLKTGAGDDILDGGNGNDKLYGGNDNDTLIGGAGADSIDGGFGSDVATFTSALAGISVDLNKGTAKSTTGNDTAGIGSDKLSNIENVIAGNYADTITGSKVSNTLTGGYGNDTFIFNTKLNAQTNVDTITDFTSGDKIALAGSIFSKLKADKDLSDNFALNSSNTVKEYLIYNSSTGKLYYDADGNANKSQPIEVAIIGVDSHPTLTASDFSII